MLRFLCCRSLVRYKLLDHVFDDEFMLVTITLVFRPEDRLNQSNSLQLLSKQHHSTLHNWRMSPRFNFTACSEMSVTDFRWVQLAAACIFTATAAMYFAKLPILIFLLRTFGVKKWLRYISYCLMVLTALAFLASALWTGVNCSPGLQDDVDQAFLFSCVSATFYTTVSRNSISLAVDVIIFIMPLPLVARLKMAPRKKIGVALVFLAGSL